MNTDSMKAAIINKYGKAGVVSVATVAKPKPKPEQILVRVHAASVNPRDWLLMRGLYKFKKIAEPFPITLGSDFSGTVEAVGSKVTKFKAGDEVFAMQPLSGKFGAFAEFVTVKESACSIKPTEITHSEAAAIPCAGMTAYQALKDLAKIKPGETVLINGASGGVGSYAIQCAKAMGAYVIAVAGPDNQQFCLGLGADEVLNYKDEKFEAKKATYDVVYDVIGRSSPKKCAKPLKPKGRYITTIPGPSTLLTSLVSKLTSWIPFGKQLKTQLILVKPEGRDLSDMADLMIKGKIKSVIDTVYPLENIEDALAKSQTWRTRGKLVIMVSD